MSLSTRFNPERVAWTVLLGAFFACCALSIGTVVGGRWWWLNATNDQKITLTHSGTVLVTRPNRPAADVNWPDPPVGSVIATDTDAQATLTFVAAESEEVLAFVQLYGNTKLTITQAQSPLYEASPDTHYIRLEVSSGRARVATGVGLARPVRVEIFSDPDAQTILTESGSSISLEATFAQTIVTVREGVAMVSAQQQVLSLTRDQRAEVKANTPPNGPLPTERNLIMNGDFQEALAGTWVTEVVPPLEVGDSIGTIDVLTRDGRRAAYFARAGRNFGQVGLRQDLNRDVLGYQRLRLSLSIFIAQQDLFNCGALGSECPLMVKLKYIDVNGGEHEWVQGFYYRFSPSEVELCVSCEEPRNLHQQFPLNQWQSFESDNLLSTLKSPATLKSISIYASGHTFESLATDIELFGAE